MIEEPWWPLIWRFRAGHIRFNQPRAYLRAHPVYESVSDFGNGGPVRSAGGYYFLKVRSTKRGYAHGESRRFEHSPEALLEIRCLLMSTADIGKRRRPGRPKPSRVHEPPHDP